MDGDEQGVGVKEDLEKRVDDLEQGLDDIRQEQGRIWQVIDEIKGGLRSAVGQLWKSLGGKSSVLGDEDKDE